MIFANKTSDDIIIEKELKGLFNNEFSNILSREDRKGYDHGLITEEYLNEMIRDHNRYIYVCSPTPHDGRCAGHVAEYWDF